MGGRVSQRCAAGRFVVRSGGTHRCRHCRTIASIVCTHDEHTEQSLSHLRMRTCVSVCVSAPISCRQARSLKWQKTGNGCVLESAQSLRHRRIYVYLYLSVFIITFSWKLSRVESIYYILFSSKKPLWIRV